jgi:hypothetical protein
MSSNPRDTRDTEAVDQLAIERMAGEGGEPKPQPLPESKPKESKSESESKRDQSDEDQGGQIAGC